MNKLRFKYIKQLAQSLLNSELLNLGVKAGMSDSKASEFLLDLDGDIQGSESVRCGAVHYLLLGVEETLEVVWSIGC